jgi:uncharacterized SAM-binding protein YcdF (DUF218 family)
MSTTKNEPQVGWLKSTSLVVLTTVCLPLLATFGVSGKSSVEKLLTNMVQPLFVAIVVVIALGVVLVRRSEARAGWLLVLGSILMWFLSSSVVVSFVVKGWEATAETTETSISEPFDYVVVLGGSTSVSPTGRAQFGPSGDRVGYAASLYLSGIAKHLVTTGDNLVITGSLTRGFKPEDDPSVQTKQIWQSLGVPADAISELPGQNTSSEMAALREHTEYWQDKHCAILTSAIHMPRAISLAKRAGVRAVPIAADYRTSTGPLSINQFFPEAEKLELLHMIFKEWIAMRINR